jgi:VCBS repeat-containing protein
VGVNGTPATVNIADDDNAPANTVPGPQTIDEDVLTPVAGISVTDADGDLATVALAVTSGILDVTLQGGAFISAGADGSATLTLSGSEADINATLATLAYQGNLDYSGPDTLTVTSTDSGGNATTDNVAITVTAVNDAPVASNLSAPETYTEDTPLNLTDIVVSDVDSGNVTVTLTLSDVAAGTLNTGTSGAVTSTFVGGVWTASGAIADVNALLAGLTFTPAADYNGNFTIATSVSDGFAPPLTGAKNITGTPVNDTPVNLVPGAQAATEDTPLPIGGISAIDPDGNVTSVTLAVGNGTLNVTAVGGAGVAGNGSGTVTITGSQADINATLASLIYQGNLDFNGADNLSVTSTDSNGATDTDNVPINVAGVNDVPANVVPPAQTVAEDTLLTIPGVSVNDVDGNIANVQLTVANGTLNVTAAGAALVVGNGSGMVTIAGTQIDINATLASLGYQGNLDYNGPDTLTVTSTDSNGATDTDSIGITVTAVNDVPVNTVPPGPLAATEDTTLTIAGLSITDPDGGTLTVSLSVTNGVLTVNLGGGATITAGANGSGALTLSGTVGQLNAALASLGYQGLANYFGPDTLNITTSDGTLSDNDIVAITVAAVNDAPVLGSNTFTINAGSPLVLGAGNLSASDVDNLASTLMFSVGSVTNGFFLVSGAQATSFTQAQLLAGQVQFVHNGAGAPGFTIFVSDGGANVGPFAANITFNGGGGFTPTPPPTSTPPSSSGITPLPSASLAAAPNASGQGFTAFLRGPKTAQEGGEGEQKVEALEMQVAQPPTGVVKTDRVFVPSMGLPPLRAQMDTLETRPQRVEPAPLQVRSLGEKGLDLDEEDRQRIEVVLNSIRLTGLTLSVGAVWWTARAVGLVASLLSATPAWRHVDPLPVLGRNEEEKEEWDDAADEKDKDKKDDEHRAAWILEEREAQS